MKRLLAILMAALMVCTLASPISANDEGDIAGPQVTDQTVDKVNDLTDDNDGRLNQGDDYQATDEENEEEIADTTDQEAGSITDIEAVEGDSEISGNDNYLTVEDNSLDEESSQQDQIVTESDLEYVEASNKDELRNYLLKEDANLEINLTGDMNFDLDTEEPLKVNGTKTLVTTIFDITFTVDSFADDSGVAAGIYINDGATLTIDSERKFGDSRSGEIVMRSDSTDQNLDLYTIFNSGTLNINNAVIRNESYLNESEVIHNDDSSSAHLTINQAVLYGMNAVGGNIAPESFYVEGLLISHDSKITTGHDSNDVTIGHIEIDGTDRLYFISGNRVYDNTWYIYFIDYNYISSYTVEFDKLSSNYKFYYFGVYYEGLTIINNSESELILHEADESLKIEDIVIKQNEKYTIKGLNRRHFNITENNDVQTYLSKGNKESFERGLSGEEGDLRSSGEMIDLIFSVSLTNQLETGQEINFEVDLGNGSEVAKKLTLKLVGIDNERIAFSAPGITNKTVEIENTGNKFYQIDCVFSGGGDGTVRIRYIQILEAAYAENNITSTGVYIGETNKIHFLVGNDDKDIPIEGADCILNASVSISNSDPAKIPERVMIYNDMDGILSIEPDNNIFNIPVYLLLNEKAIDDVLEECEADTINIDLANGDYTLKSLQDSIDIKGVNKPVVIDLQGKDLKSLYGGVFDISGSNNVTIKNGSITLAQGASGNTLDVTNGSIVYLENVTINHEASNGSPVYVDEGSKVIISGDNNKVTLVTGSSSDNALKMRNDSTLEIGSLSTGGLSTLKLDGENDSIVLESSTVNFIDGSSLIIDGNQSTVIQSDGTSSIIGYEKVGLVENGTNYSLNQNAQKPIEDVDKTDVSNDNDEQLGNMLKEDSSELNDYVSSDSAEDVVELKDLLDEETIDKNVSVVIESAPMIIEAESSSKDVKAITNDSKIKDAGAELVNMVNIDAMLQVQATTLAGVVSTKQAKLAKLPNPVEITLYLPSINAEKEYQVIRVHDGEVTPLATSIGNQTNEGYPLTFETDKFSTYGIIELDEQIPTGEETVPGGDDQESKPDHSRPSNPNRPISDLEKPSNTKECQKEFGDEYIWSDVYDACVIKFMIVDTSTK